jgi:hypothetical protein
MTRVIPLDDHPGLPDEVAVRNSPPGEGRRCRGRGYSAARFAIADVNSVTTTNATAIVASTARPPSPYRTQLLPPHSGLRTYIE